MVSHDFRLISQVAEQLWEVKDKKIKDLSKEDVDMLVLLLLVLSIDELITCAPQYQVQEHAD